MDPYTVEERKIEKFWDDFWEEYEKYPPGTRFQHNSGGTLVKMAVNGFGMTESNLFVLSTGAVSYVTEHFRYPQGFTEWNILSCTGEPYQH